MEIERDIDDLALMATRLLEELQAMKVAWKASFWSLVAAFVALSIGLGMASMSNSAVMTDLAARVRWVERYKDQGMILVPREDFLYLQKAVEEMKKGTNEENENNEGSGGSGGGGGGGQGGQ